jgi:transcriptional regulator
MYVPQAFRATDRATLLSFAASQPFATVISHRPVQEDEEGLAVSHLPLQVDAERGKLRGHLARENPQYRHFSLGADVLVVFHGPHGYVSPSVYSEPGVPTWNYVVVHVRGTVRLASEAELRAILDESVARFDTSGWSVESIGDLLDTKLRAIAGFEIDIRSLEGKWKLSQNRSAGDRARVASWLEGGDESSKATARMMREMAGPGT